MALRVRTKIQVAISSSEQEERDLGYPLIDAVNDALGEGGTLKAHVAAGATLLQLPLGVVANGKFLFLRTEARDANETPVDLAFRKNSTTGEVITVSPMGDSGYGVLLLSTTGITALYVSNAGAVNMDVIYSIAGD